MGEHILLIGLRDAGKTSVGKALASQLSLAFIDTDALIETGYRDRFGEILGIKAIHLRLGEDSFRALESEIIASLNPPERSVIATGGGSILSEKNRKHLVQLGTVIYLDVSQDTLLTRWQNDIPTFSSASTLQTDLQRYYTSRRPIGLTMADLCIDTNRRSVAELVSEISSKLLK